MIIPDKDLFLAACRQVIKKLEGGYFHPHMYIENPTKFRIYNTSGETMYGLDRHAGFNLYYKGTRKTSNVQDNLRYIESGVYEYKTDAAKKFWTLLDSVNAKNTFPWLHMGGANEEKLILLASEIMYPEFLALADLNLSDEAKKLVFSDPRLLFHFIYATWNGQGFFKFYAKELERAIKQHFNLEEIVDDQIKQRLSSRYEQIRKSGNIMKDLFTNVDFKKAFENLAGKINNNSKILPLLVAGLIITGYLIVKKMQA